MLAWPQGAEVYQVGPGTGGEVGRRGGGQKGRGAEGEGEGCRKRGGACTGEMVDRRLQGGGEEVAGGGGCGEGEGEWGQEERRGMGRGGAWEGEGQGRGGQEVVGDRGEGGRRGGGTIVSSIMQLWYKQAPIRIVTRSVAMLPSSVI